MNLIRKTVIFILVCLIVGNFISLSAFADVNGGKLEISDSVAKAGDTIDINVKLSDNPGFISANIYVNYDESVLALEKVTDGKILTGAAHSDNYSSPYGLCWMNDLSTENIKSNGVLAILTFKVKSSSKTDTSITIEQDVVNYKLDNVIFEVTGGNIKLNSDDAPRQSSHSKSQETSDDQLQEDHSNSLVSGNKKNSQYHTDDEHDHSNDTENTGSSSHHEIESTSDNRINKYSGQTSENETHNVQIDDQSEKSNSDTKSSSLSTKDTAIASASNNGEFPVWIIFLVILFFAVIVVIVGYIIRKRKNTF